MREWQYLHQGRLVGPVGEQELEAMLLEGRLAPDTMMWTDGADRWETVTDILRPESAAVGKPARSFSRGALAACAAGMAGVLAVPFTLPLGIVGLFLGLRSVREIDESQFTLQPLRGRAVAISASILCGIEAVLFALLIVRLS